jgi:tRNA(fMet)-specific endonuclease VapC
VTARFLLDTNVVSEPLRASPDAGILSKLREHEGELAIASLSWHELLFGCERLAPSRKRDAIGLYLRETVLDSMEILPYDLPAADWHARERARLAAGGRTPPFVDGQIAAIAKVHALVLVTANRADFARFEGLQLEDWRA